MRGIPGTSESAPESNPRVRKAIGVRCPAISLVPGKALPSRPRGIPGAHDGAGERREPTWAVAVRRTSHGGGRMGGAGVPEPSPSSSQSLVDAPPSSARANPKTLPDDLERTRGGAAAARPKCRSILPTTCGSVRNASTTIGTGRPGREHLGHASPSRWSTRRRSCAQEVRFRDLPERGRWVPRTSRGAGSAG
jgi:hypothetical protein